MTPKPDVIGRLVTGALAFQIVIPTPGFMRQGFMRQGALYHHGWKAWRAGEAMPARLRHRVAIRGWLARAAMEGA